MLYLLSDKNDLSGLIKINSYNLSIKYIYKYNFCIIIMKVTKKCIFCEIVKGIIPSLKVYEDNTTIAFLDINPASLGHTLIILKKHYEDIYTIPNNDLVNIINVAKIISERYRSIFNIKAINLISSNGKEAQQDIFHFHFHLIPRNNHDGIKFYWKNRKEDFLEKSKEFVRKLKNPK